MVPELPLVSCHLTNSCIAVNPVELLLPMHAVADIEYVFFVDDGPIVTVARVDVIVDGNEILPELSILILSVVPI